MGPYFGSNVTVNELFLLPCAWIYVCLGWTLLFPLERWRRCQNPWTRHITNTDVAITSTSITTRIKIHGNEHAGLICVVRPLRQMRIFRRFGRHLVIFGVNGVGGYRQALLAIWQWAGKKYWRFDHQDTPHLLVCTHGVGCDYRKHRKLFVKCSKNPT
jgi:hypothetical protein